MKFEQLAYNRGRPIRDPFRSSTPQARSDAANQDSERMSFTQRDINALFKIEVNQPQEIQ